MQLLLYAIFLVIGLIPYFVYQDILHWSVVCIIFIAASSLSHLVHKKIKVVKARSYQKEGE